MRLYDRRHVLGGWLLANWSKTRGSVDRGLLLGAVAVSRREDDHVVPGHSFEYAAALQAAQIGDNPKLIRIETRAGHGSGRPTGKVIEEDADLWAFLAEHTGLELPESYGN